MMFWALRSRACAFFDRSSNEAVPISVAWKFMVKESANHEGGEDTKRNKKYYSASLQLFILGL